MSEGQSVIKLGGCSRLVGNAAGEHGGGIHANGAHMEVSAECLELLSNTAGAQGGGLYYGTQVEIIGGEILIDGNSAYQVSSANWRGRVWEWLGRGSDHRRGQPLGRVTEHSRDGLNPSHPTRPCVMSRTDTGDAAYRMGEAWR
eukprot:3477642-Rhodomonas_salina.1